MATQITEKKQFSFSVLNPFRKKTAAHQDNSPKNLQTTKLIIKGMHCGNCANTLTKVFANIKGVTKADVQFATKTATLEHEPTVTRATLITVVKKAGYAAE